MTNEIYQNIIALAEKARENRSQELTIQDKNRPSDWYKDEVVYMFYPDQFGIDETGKPATFKTLIGMLDYLNILGVTTIYILPFADSPMGDSGFDVKNPKNVRSDLGGLSEFNEFMIAARKKGFKIKADLILNHFSDKHEWFQEALKGDIEKLNYFIVKEEAPVAPAERKKLGFVSICAGDGFADIFKNLGVDEVIEGGQTMNPSTEDILNAVKKVNADNVIVFPNNKNIILAANQAAIIEEDKKVFVVETTAVPEGITAMINYNPDEEIEDIIEEMNEAKGMVKTCTTTFAVRDTVIDDKEITEGDILGMYNGAIAVIAKDKQEGTKELVKQAIDEDSEIISIYYGSDVTEEDAEEIGEFIEEEFPDCEVEIVRGGQPLYYYVISVE